MATSPAKQIERHSNLELKLNAALSVYPRDVAISQAKAFDEEWRQWKSLGEPHGIPIIVKVGDKTGIRANLDGFTVMSRTASLQNLPWAWYLRQTRVQSHLFNPRAMQAW